MIHPCCYCLSCFLEFPETRVTWGKSSNMLHYYFVRFSSEPEYFESSESEHLVVVLAIVDGDEVGEQLLFGGEGGVGSNPIFGIAHR